jgi:hypothetical protein
MMQNVTKLLLKHGVEGLISENEDFFRQNITQALALKLNESVKEIRENVSEKLLFNDTYTTESGELSEFLNFIDNFKPGIYNFKNGSSINITESNIDDLQELFECLNPQNRQKMVSEIFTDAITFKQHLNFFQKAKQVL